MLSMNRKKMMENLEDDDGNHDPGGAKDLTEVICKLIPYNIGKDI